MEARHPTGFRVVLIEAGHIAQNMLLAATASGLVATPTCALNDSMIGSMSSMVS
ncbi:nitroreductase family protein, partial [Rhizobium ruizarguesonis]